MYCISALHWCQQLVSVHFQHPYWTLYFFLKLFHMHLCFIPHHQTVDISSCVVVSTSFNSFTNGLIIYFVITCTFLCLKIHASKAVPSHPWRSFFAPLHVYLLYTSDPPVTTLCPPVILLAVPSPFHFQLCQPLHLILFPPVAFAYILHVSIKKYGSTS